MRLNSGLALLQQGLDYDQLLYRWVHVIAGVVWLAMLYSFTLVYTHSVAALQADVRKQVALQYIPRMMFWFKWAALMTWLTGAALLMKLYYSSKAAPLMYASTSEFAGTHMPWSQVGQAFGLLFGLLVVYELLARVAGKYAELSCVAWAAVAVGYGCFLDSRLEMSHRAILIHIGALLGTAMAANAWMHIAPAFERSVAAMREGHAPNQADLARAGVRSRHNLFMSMPLLLLMLSVHQERLLGFERWQIPIAGLMIVGLGIGWSLRRFSAEVGE